MGNFGNLFENQQLSSKNMKNVGNQTNLSTIRESESFLQQQCWLWFNNNYCLKNQKNRCLIFAIPNGGSRDIREAMTLKNTGVLSGVSDLQILFPNKCIFVEIKLPTGVQSDTQKDFEHRVSKLGFDYYIARSLQEFKQIVTLHLRDN